jgi:hypothetical protein
MVSAKHGKQTLAQGLHAAISYEYANSAARLAATGFTSEDKYKLSYQIDTGAVYILSDPTGPTWDTFGSGTSGTAGGDLAGTYPNPTVVDLTISGQSQGAILYYNGSNWVVLSPGTDGYVLTTHSTGANPDWTAATTGALSSTPPVDVTKATASVGTSIFAARSDHKHNIATGTATSVGATNTEGSSTSLARADHTHAVIDLDISGQQKGSILYFNGTNWVVLSPGTDGYVLTAHGVGVDPAWNAPSGGVAISAGTQLATSGTVSFVNSNGFTFGMSNSNQITGSYTVPSIAGLISAVNFSAGTTSNNLSAVTFSNLNGLTFGLDGSTITGSYTVPTQSNQTVGLYALGNTTQNSSTTLDARSLSFNGLGAATVGYSNGSIQVSVPVQTVQTQSLIAGIYDGANSISTGTIRFSNANGVTFGINGQTLTGSVTPQSVQSIGIYHVGNTTGQSSSSTFDARSLSFQGGGIVSVGNSNGSVIISAVAAGAGDGGNILIAGTQTAISNASVVFSNSNGMSFGMSNSSVITASYTVPSTAGLISAVNLSAGTTSNNLTNFVLSNSNNVSFGLNGSTITASIPSQTNQTLGLYAIGNTTGQSSSSTFDARTLSVSGVGGASVGYSGNNLIISAPLEKKVSQLIWPENPWQTNFQISNASFSLQHFNAKENITATQANLLMALSGNTNSTGALTISLGLYTMNGSTMSLASSDSRQITWTSGAATNSSSVFGGVSGTRYRTVSLANWSISAGDYVLGMWFRTTNNGTWNAFGQQGPTIVGAVDVNETQAYLHGFSTSSFTTAMVASINVTDTNYVRTGGNALQQPAIIFLGTY